MADHPETIRLLRHIRFLCAVVAVVSVIWLLREVYPIARQWMAGNVDSLMFVVFAGMVIAAIGLLTMIGIRAGSASVPPSNNAAASRDVVEA